MEKPSVRNLHASAGVANGNRFRRGVIYIREYLSWLHYYRRSNWRAGRRGASAWWVVTEFTLRAIY